MGRRGDAAETEAGPLELSGDDVWRAVERLEDVRLLRRVDADALSAIAIRTSRPDAAASIAMMLELTIRLRRRATPIARSSDPDGCFTRRRQGGVDMSARRV